MANFRLTNQVPTIYAGGPPNRCAICQFEQESPRYLILDGVFAEAPFPSFNGGQVEHTVIFCDQHITELKTLLDEILPDPKMPALQGKLLKAEAARAKAEHRAEVAEKALYSMQEWISEQPATLSPGGK